MLQTVCTEIDIAYIIFKIPSDFSPQINYLWDHLAQGAIYSSGYYVRTRDLTFFAA